LGGGETIKWKAKGCLNGLMEGIIRVSM